MCPGRSHFSFGTFTLVAQRYLPGFCMFELLLSATCQPLQVRLTRLDAFVFTPPACVPLTHGRPGLCQGLATTTCRKPSALHRSQAPHVTAVFLQPGILDLS